MLTQTAMRTDMLRRSPAHPPMPARGASMVPNHVDSDAHPLEETMHLMGATMSYPRNTEIFGENDPADYLYMVVSGTVRTYKILSDGRRQIGGFYLPGDIFGLEYANQHTLSAEAVSDTKVLVVKRSTLTALAA